MYIHNYIHVKLKSKQRLRLVRCDNTVFFSWAFAFSTFECRNYESSKFIKPGVGALY